MKICSIVPGHMTKMASRSLYGKKPSKVSFFGTKKPMNLKLGIQLRVLKYYQICSNDNTGLNLPIFMTWSNLFRNASEWVKAYTAYSHVISKVILIQHIRCTQVSDTRPYCPLVCMYFNCYDSASTTY